MWELGDFDYNYDCTVPALAPVPSPLVVLTKGRALRIRRPCFEALLEKREIKGRARGKVWLGFGLN